jgi:RNA polymerase sigma factor (sigma-70 family)
MWHETPEEVEEGLEWGRKKAELLQWVKRKMGRRLTKEERRCMELYYFRGLTYLEVAKATGVSVATAHRTVARSIKKLQESLKRARSTNIRAARKASREP